MFHLTLHFWNLIIHQKKEKKKEQRKKNCHLLDLFNKCERSRSAKRIKVDLPVYKNDKKYSLRHKRPRPKIYYSTPEFQT